MKELWKLAWLNLKTNKIHSVCMTIAISLSFMLLTCFALYEDGLNRYSEEINRFNYGEYHISYHYADENDLFSLLNETDIEQHIQSNPQGYVKQQDGTYITITGIDEIPKKTLFSMVEGSYPRKSNEIVVSFAYAKKYQCAIGDIIELNVGDVKGDKENPKLSNSLEFIYKEKKKYRISGIYVPGIASNEPFFTDEMIVYTPNLKSIEKGYVYLNCDALKVKEIERKLKSASNFILNQKAIFSTYGNILENPTFPMQEKQNDIKKIIMKIILLYISICTMYSIFLISLPEKKKHIGILQCLGATKKQITIILYTELLFFYFICVPLGIGCGFLVMKGIEPWIVSFFYQYACPVQFYIGLSLFQWIRMFIIFKVILLLAFLFSLKTIRKQSMIQLCRQNNRLRLKIRNKFQWREKILGYEALLAKQYLDINRKHYYSTQLAIFVSVFILLFSGYIAQYGLYTNDYTKMNVFLHTKNTVEDIKTHLQIAESIKQLPSVKKETLEITLNLSNVSYGINKNNKKGFVSFKCTDDINIQKKLTKKNQVLVRNRVPYVTTNGQVKEKEILSINPKDILKLTYGYYQEEAWKTNTFSFVCVGTKRTDETTQEMVYNEDSIIDANLEIYCTKEMLVEIIQTMNFKDRNLYRRMQSQIILKGKNQNELYEEVLKESVKYPQQRIVIFTPQEKNIEERMREQMLFESLIISIPLIVMGMLNLISSVIFSLQMKNKDNAILKSIGMTHKQMIKMLFFEIGEVLLKALTLGIIAGLGMNYLFYCCMITSVFKIQWMWILAVCTIIISMLVISVLFGVKQMCKKSIMENIKTM